MLDKGHATLLLHGRRRIARNAILQLACHGHEVILRGLGGVSRGLFGSVRGDATLGAGFGLYSVVSVGHIEVVTRIVARHIVTDTQRYRYFVLHIPGA